MTNRLHTWTAAPLLLTLLLSSLAASQGVVLLRSGHLLHGEVVSEGDHVLVLLGNQSEVRLERSRVELVANSIDEVYRYRRSQTDNRDLASRLELVRWCLRHNLEAEATDELIPLMQSTPNHPSVRELERQLTERARPQAAPVAVAVDNRPLTPAQLEAALQHVPRDVVESFTNQIQPMLLNHCATSGCHGLVGKSEYRLIRSPWGSSVTRQVTQRNLNATLAQIRRDAPSESPLLLATTGSHAASTKPILDGSHRRSLESLQAWVERVSRDTAQAKPEAVPKAPPEPLMQPSNNIGGAKPALHTEPVEAKPAVTNASSTTETKPSGFVNEKRVQVGAPGTFVPRDDFDAEIFNRKFFNDRYKKPEK